MERTAIHVRNLRKCFRKRNGFRKVSELWALDDVSFSVAEGETYGLLGPNGSGKSSLIRILSTLLIADSGEVEMLGHPLPAEQEQVRRIIGRVSVDAAFYKKLSARENLLYTALLYGQKARDAEKRAIEILEELGMENTKFSTPLEEMSRGMQQKISIARALILNPPLLLLDEPTTGLDPKSRRDVQTFLEKQKVREGTTILLTTHDMAEADGNNNATNVGLSFSRLPLDAALHWLGHRLQLLRRSYIRDSGVDRRCGRKLSINHHTRGWSVAVELHVVTL
jgi:ABC-2 type transport system ATP-binding protein